ncbi:MAG: NPCBM/NEW2 domain-containing protein [Acetatifactor sp.]|nr:NPCBM/NEW2 domain-containing protein [Acetatifactor sp.]
MNKTILAAIIGAGATITAAVIGVYVGRDYEQNIVQNQIEEVIGDNVNVIGDGNTITVNDVKSLAESYINLQDQYDELQNQNNFLLGENVKYNEDLQAANDKISELSSETDQEIQQLQNQISQMYNVDFQNISLTINGVDSGHVDRVATINNETFYSIGFLQYIVDNMAVSSNNSRLFIGNVQSEEQMPVSLFDLEPFTKGCLSKETSMKDTYGNEYEEVFKVNTIIFLSNNPILYAQEYNVECKYSKFEFDIFFPKEADQTTEYEIIVYGDNKQLKTATINRKSKLHHIEIDISGVEFLQIVGMSEATHNDYYFGMVNPYLYP